MLKSYNQAVINSWVNRFTHDFKDTDQNTNLFWALNKDFVSLDIIQ